MLTPAEYEAAMARLLDLMHDGSASNPEEVAEFERLTEQIEAYEHVHCPPVEPSILDAVAFRADQENSPLTSAIEAAIRAYQTENDPALVAQVECPCGVSAVSVVPMSCVGLNQLECSCGQNTLAVRHLLHVVGPSATISALGHER